MLKKLMIVAIAAFSLNTSDAQQLKTPAPSPTQTVKQDFGISSLELIYSRPSAKGRKVFGDLVPYGKVWRTGANNATRLKFNDDVTVGGKLVKAGEYAVFTVPNANEWEIIINKGSQNWGTVYNQQDDIVRVKATPFRLAQPVETFTMQFENIKPNTVDLAIMWENTGVRLPISTEIDSKIMAQIQNAMFKDNRPYFSAAMYYLEANKDLNQAVQWFDKALEQNPNAFWIYHQKANALARQGKKAEALAAATKSMAMAAEQKNDDYVELNKKLIATLGK